MLRLVSNGEPIMAVARKMGISDSLIHAWRKANDKGESKTDQDLQKEVDSLRKQLRQAEMDRTAEAARDPKKSCCHFQPTNLTMTYQFIRSKEGDFPVRLLCKMMNVSKTAYYTYRNGTTFTPSDSDLVMTTAIDKIFWENSRRYGSRRVLEALKEQGVKAGRHRIRRLMQEQDWRAIQPRSRFGL